MRELLDKLNKYKSLTLCEYQTLLENPSPDYAKALAKSVNLYKNTVFLRGLIEVSNICKNDCFYCGIRASNKNCVRYRLSKEQILDCADIGYPLGLRTFVLQGGENAHFSDEFVCDIIKSIKAKYSDVAITLSLGERSKQSYKRLFDAGADRYLLRHETADKEHYEKLHPDNMSFDSRMQCLYDLKQIGYQVGAGFMVGSPFQSTRSLAKDLKFIEEFDPDMCGVGPFLPHSDTPFASMPRGKSDLTLYLLSIIRIMKPGILLPSTTALSSASDDGQENGLLAGANVIMPNLSPMSARDKYTLYDGKRVGGSEAAENIALLKQKLAKIGYKIVVTRGDRIDV